MEQINVAMIPAVLAGIVKQLEAIDGWLTLKTEPVLNGTIGPQEDWIGSTSTASPTTSSSRPTLIRNIGKDRSTRNGYSLILKPSIIC